MKTSLRQRRQRRPAEHRRSGTILVLTSLILLVLVGMVGLVVDAGQLMTTQRVCQNAADSAAMAASFELLRGRSVNTSRQVASQFVNEHNALPNAVVIVSSPPVSGSHVGQSSYVEVWVINSVATRLIQVLGGPNTRIVGARSVAGYESATIGAGIITLNPAARPGIGANGNGILKVNGTVIDNSNGGGRDEFGQWINNGNTGSAISLSGNAAIYARNIQSVGGVSLTDDSLIRNYDPGNSSSPLHTRAPTQPDPLAYLPTPTTANGAVGTNYGAVKVTGNNSVTLNPGVYTSINLSANGNIFMNPGIYIIKGGGMSVTGNGDITANNVLIYNTGSDFNVNTGLPDAGDVALVPPSAGNATFGAISIAGNGEISMTPYSNPSSPFDGLTFYQRRLNTQAFDLTGNAQFSGVYGTIYAKWAELKIAGNGVTHSQFAVGQTTISGNGTITIDYAGYTNAKSTQVYLVE